MPRYCLTTKQNCYSLLFLARMSLMILLARSSAVGARSELCCWRRFLPTVAATLPNHQQHRRYQKNVEASSSPVDDKTSLLMKRKKIQNEENPVEEQQKVVVETRGLSSSSSSTTTASDGASSEFSKAAAVTPKKLSLSRRAQQTAGDIVSAVGFLISSTTALWFDRTQYKRLKPSVQALQNFLRTSGIDLELSPSLNMHLLNNIVILGRIHKTQQDRREIARKQKAVDLPSTQEALRYMKYATAAYGNSMIRAAEMDVLGQFSNRWNQMTRECISDHVGVRQEDIVLLDIHSKGDGNHLRHFVAVDHENKKVVLAIRGTFALSEVIVDVAGFSTPFCGGEAHSEMAAMAERVWKAAGETVLDLLRANDGYDLILTGHSLGGGTACLLNIMCHRNRRELVEGRQVQCFAYAAPPVYTPLDFVPQAVNTCTNYIHDTDMVPFLSMDSVRHLFSSVRVIENAPGMNWFRRMRCAAGSLALDPELEKAVYQARQKRLPPRKGAPLLEIPAEANVWLRRIHGSDNSYDYTICDSSKLARLGVAVDANMLRDHFPSRYENALHNLKGEYSANS